MQHMRELGVVAAAMRLRALRELVHFRSGAQPEAGAQLLALVRGGDKAAARALTLLSSQPLLALLPLDAEGTTALHAAARAGALLVAQALVGAAGADPLAKDGQGRTALDCAREANQVALSEWLEAFVQGRTPARKLPLSVR